MNPPRATTDPFASAFHDALIGMTLLSPHHQRLQVNRAFCDLLGYSEQELLALSLPDLVHPDDVEEDRRQRARLLAGDASSYRREKRYLHRDGRILWADFSCTLVRGDDGTPQHFIAQVQDITDRKLAQQALQRSEQQLREAQALTSIAVQVGHLGAWGYDVGARTLTCSSELCAILGVRPPFAPTPRAALLMFARECRGKMRRIVRDALRSGTPFDVDAQVVTGRGRVAWVRVVCEAQWDARGQVVRLHGALQDISQARSALDALGESRRALATLLANLPGMAYRCLNRMDWPLEFASDGAFALTGHTPAQLVGGQPKYGDLIHPHDQQAVWTEVQAAVADRRQFQSTYRLCTPQGEKWVWEKGAPVFGAEGDLRCVEGFIIDITRSQLARQEIALLNESLEERVRTRTEQLQLANSELESFAYSIAHDLRAPMTSLAGYSSLLEQHLKPDADRQGLHFLARIGSNVRRMSDITDALLALAGLSGVALAWDEVDLAELAREQLALLQEQDPQRVAEIDVDEAIPARGDRRLLRQVMTNLLSNAWKFSAGRPVTRIRVQARSRVDGETVYSVADEGVGFDMAHTGELFGAFRRLHGPSEFEGMGVGLAVVRKIVLRHRGRIWADARPGEGATFFFTLGRTATTP
jgi:PAS domain S-box-containing protein